MSVNMNVSGYQPSVAQAFERPDENLRLWVRSALVDFPLCTFVSFVVNAFRQDHFFSSSVQFVTTVIDWLTCWEITLRSIFLPSGVTS